MNEKQSAAWRSRFGGKLRELRHACNLSQEELAHRAGLDSTYVSGCERGRRNLSLESMHRLAHALKCSPTKFFE